MKGFSLDARRVDEARSDAGRMVFRVRGLGIGVGENDVLDEPVLRKPAQVSFDLKLLVPVPVHGENRDLGSSPRPA